MGDTTAMTVGTTLLIASFYAGNFNVGPGYADRENYF